MSCNTMAASNRRQICMPNQQTANALIERLPRTTTPLTPSHSLPLSVNFAYSVSLCVCVKDLHTQSESIQSQKVNQIVKMKANTNSHTHTEKQPKRDTHTHTCSTHPHTHRINCWSAAGPKNSLCRQKNSSKTAVHSPSACLCACV